VLVNAIFYVVKTGCQWRNLPTDFPSWGTTYHYYRLWKRNGLWAAIHTHLRETVRLAEGRNRRPSAGIIDSQSVKSSEVSEERGYDAGKKVNGRKRHILVDTIGLIVAVIVLPANIQDRDAAKQLLLLALGQRTRNRIRHIWADGGYAGMLLPWAWKACRCTIEIVKRSDLHTFKVLPRRWVVERTFGWLGRLPSTQPRLQKKSQLRRNHGLLGHDSTYACPRWKTLNPFFKQPLTVGGAVAM
jgi:putative transposase